MWSGRGVRLPTSGSMSAMRLGVFAATPILAALMSLLPPREQVRWSADPRPGPGVKGAIVMRSGVLLCARGEGSPDGVRVVCMESRDRGGTWAVAGTIVSGPHGADIGDGCLIELPGDRLLYSYRDNRTGGQDRRYAIRVAESTDSGKTWRPHSTVAECAGDKGGLWSSFLFRTRSGDLLCMYDDERTPWEAGLPHHQWLTIKRWNPESRTWHRPVTVSRAHNPAHLSRDGMGSIIETAPGHLLCVFETVDTAPPHAGVIMSVTSDDGGRTWSWSATERSTVYQARDRRFGAHCPWTVRARDGRIVCVFGLNEGRDQPIRSGTPLPELGLDIVAVESSDQGVTWSRPIKLVEGTHRNALPGILSLPGGSGDLYVHWVDFDRGYLALIGKLP